MKKILSLCLCVLMLASVLTVNAGAVSTSSDQTAMTVKEALDAYEKETGLTVETNRYYFLMPNGSNGLLSEYEDSKYESTWYTDDASTASVYWWDAGVADPENWPGYQMTESDVDDIYYADIPKAVKMMVFNNGINGSMDTSDPVYYLAKQTKDIPCELYSAGEHPAYPDGVESFDNMIYVIDPDLITTSSYESNISAEGYWYYYYGNGCFGTTKDGNSNDCIRDDHFDANGNHIVSSTLLGDVTGDNMLSIFDATEIQLVLAQAKDWSFSNAEALADFDNDGEVSIMYASAIQRNIAGIE